MFLVSFKFFAMKICSHPFSPSSFLFLSFSVLFSLFFRINFDFCSSSRSGKIFIIHFEDGEKEKERKNLWREWVRGKKLTRRKKRKNDKKWKRRYKIIINQTMSRTKEINVRMMTVIPTENWESFSLFLFHSLFLFPASVSYISNVERMMKNSELWMRENEKVEKRGDWDKEKRERERGEKWKREPWGLSSIFGNNNSWLTHPLPVLKVLCNERVLTSRIESCGDGMKILFWC